MILPDKINAYLKEPRIFFELCNVLSEYQVEVIIAKPRATKLGDYRYPNRNHGHIITVNSNLSNDAFLVTLLHEIAHLVVAVKYKNYKPHGKEWKYEYRVLLQQFLELEAFSNRVQNVITQNIFLIERSTNAVHNIERALREQNIDEKLILIDHLNDGDYFSYKNRKFKRLYKRRTRIKCQEISSGRYYLFSALAGVQTVDN